MELRNWYIKSDVIFGTVYFDNYGEIQTGEIEAIQSPYIWDDYEDHVIVKKMNGNTENYDYIKLDKRFKKKE